MPFVMELILDLIKCYPISSEEFYQHILPFVGRNTSHFMHEFENFAKSTMPDMRSYDENTQYVPFTQLVDSNSDASSSDDDDDDVIVLSPRETTTATATATTSRNQSSISVSISLGHPSQQIVMTSSSWDKQSSDKSQAESSTSNGQTSMSGWESPQPGPSGVLPSSIIETTNATTESTTAEPCPASESTLKLETSKRRQIDSSSDSNESEANGEKDNDEEDDDSDVVITGYEKPWAERSPILISDLDDRSDEEEETEQAAEKSEDTNVHTRSSVSGENHRSAEGSEKRSSSQQKERSRRKSRHDKYSSSSSHSNEQRRRGHNLHSSTTSSFETTVFNKRISSRSRSKSRSASRSRHSKRKNSSSSYSTKERRSHRQRHRDDSPTSSSSSLQLHISQRSIFCPLSYSNVYRVGSHPRRTLTEHSSSACDYESYSHTRSRRKHRNSYTPTSPLRHPSRARSRSSSVEIIACKRQRRNHKKHKKHKHRKHHRSKHSSKVSSSACGSVSDSNFASGSDVMPISPPPASTYKKHHSGYKNSHLKRIPTSPSTDDVRIIATVHGEGSYLDSFQKYSNSLRPTASSTATCSRSFKERAYPMSPLGSCPSSPIIDAETIGADVVIPSEGNDCQVGLDIVGEKVRHDDEGLTKTISVPVSTCGTLDEINDPDLKLMIPDLMDVRPNSPSSPSSRKPDCMQANSSTSTTLTSASRIGLSSCALDSSKWLPLSLSAEQPSPPANPDCRYSGKNAGDFCPFIGGVDRVTPDTHKPAATVTLDSASDSKLPTNSNGLNIFSSVFESSLMSSESNSSFSSTISVTDHAPITHRLKPFSMSLTTPLEPGPSTSLASFQPLPLQIAFDDHDITIPMSSTHPVDTQNNWTPQEQKEEAAEEQSSSHHENSCSNKEALSTTLLDTLSTICSTSVAKLSETADNSDLKKSNLLPLYSTATETWQSSSSSSLSTLAAAASLSISTDFAVKLSSEKAVYNTTSTTTNITTTSEISSLFSSFTAVPTTASTVSSVPKTAALSLTSSERKAREEAICTDSDIQSLISDVFALNSQSDIIPSQRESMRSSRSPSPSLQQGEKTPNSGTYNNYQAQSPIPSTTQGKLLIDMGNKDYDKKSDVDNDDDDDDEDDDDYSGSDSSSNLMSFFDKNQAQHPKQPEHTVSSALEAKRQMVSSAPLSPSSSDNKAERLYEYSSLNLSSNKKSSLKMTFKRLKPSSRVDEAVQDSSSKIPSIKQESMPSASSSQSGSSSDCSDSESSNQGDHCRTQTSSELKHGQNSPALKESALNDTLTELSIGRTNSPEKPDPDSPTVAPKDSVHSSYQADSAANCFSQDNLFDESSSDASNAQSCKDPDSSGLQLSATGSPPQVSKPLGRLSGHQVSKPSSQDSSRLEGHSEESSSGSEELDNKECEGSNHGTDYKMIRSSELHSQGDVSDEFHSGIDDEEEEEEEDHTLFSSSEL